MRLLGRSFPRAGKAGARDIKKDLPFHSASGVRVRVVQALVYVNSRLETLQECLAAALESFKGHDFLIVCDSREDTTRGYLAEFAAEHSSRLVLNLDPL